MTLKAFPMVVSAGSCYSADIKRHNHINVMCNLFVVSTAGFLIEIWSNREGFFILLTVLQLFVGERINKHDSIVPEEWTHFMYLFKPFFVWHTARSFNHKQTPLEITKITKYFGVRFEQIYITYSKCVRCWLRLSSGATSKINLQHTVKVGVLISCIWLH